MGRLFVLALSTSMLIIAPVAAGPPARIAIVIDDLGYRPELDQAVLNLDARIAVAVIPGGPRSREVAGQAAQQGREVLIHLPLAHAASGICEAAPCPRREWSAERMRMHLEWADRQVPRAVGLNNHQGSLFTADEASTRRLVEGLVLLNRQREKPLFLIDSRTTPHSHLAREAMRAGIAAGQRHVFLDHERSPEAIARAWGRAIERAMDKGHAIAIGHPYPETVEFLAGVVTTLDGSAVGLVPVSELVAPAELGLTPPGQAAAARAYRPSTE